MAAAEAIEASAERSSSNGAVGGGGGAHSSGPALPAEVSEADGRFLEEVMRRRRETCAEFESFPGSSTADFGGASSASLSLAPTSPSSPSSPVAAPAATPSAPMSSHASAVTSAGGGLTSSALAFGPRRSDDDLRELLTERRGRCLVLESEPVAATADALCGAATSARKPCAADAVTDENPRADSCSAAHAARFVRNNGYAGSGSFAVSAKCAVAPVATASAAPSAAQQLMATESLESAATEALPVASEACVCAASSSTLEPEDTASTAASDLHETTEFTAAWDSVRCGQPLPRNLRRAAWRERLLPPTLPAGNGDSSSSSTAQAVASLLRREQEASAEVGDETAMLSGAFASRFLSRADHAVGIAAVGSDASDVPVSVAAQASANSLCVTLARLLRYHCPEAAAPIELYSSRGDLADALRGVFGGEGAEAAELLWLLLAPPGAQPVAAQEADTLLLMCDRSILEDLPDLPLFVALALLISAPTVPGAPVTPEALRRALSGLRRGGLSRCAQVIEDALSLLRATPRSAVAVATATRTARPLPVCTVAAEEVLEHVYGRPSADWRLVVVDVRGEGVVSTLPVCIRSSPAARDRWEELRKIPIADSVHLCFVGDSPPGAGDMAFEYCRRLTGPPTLRRHVSVVQGGWPLLEQIARARGSDLVSEEASTSCARTVAATGVGAAGLTGFAGGLASIATGLAAGAGGDAIGARSLSLREAAAKAEQQVAAARRALGSMLGSTSRAGSRGRVP
eukprot:TRINITY_DN3023_c0_g1_i1.p1 TRINITY_DN3023_c0_g1~~TRINITY_DN3023_c0_g1_i1.p1  ORF type:complete len:747 (-),score=175.01 TRINITY_DN3023_c0_g1_i1:64-2304(-)